MTHNLNSENNLKFVIVSDVRTLVSFGFRTAVLPVELSSQQKLETSFSSSIARSVFVRFVFYGGRALFQFCYRGILRDLF